MVRCGEEVRPVVDQERARLPADPAGIQDAALHTVKLKIALARKLMRSDPRRAEVEMREVHALVSDTIARTRTLARTRRRISFPMALENARNLLEAAGIHVRVDLEGQLDDRADELFGRVLQEATGNILRHTSAAEVRISLTDSSVVVASYGAQGPPRRELKGLRALKEQMAVCGGDLTVEHTPGLILMTASLPRGRAGKVTSQ